jgi:hypothetical protein
MSRTSLREHGNGDGHYCSYVLQNLGAATLDRVRFEDNLWAQGAILNGGQLRGSNVALVENRGFDGDEATGGVGLHQDLGCQPPRPGPPPSTHLVGVEIRDNVLEDRSGGDAPSSGGGVSVVSGTVHLIDAVIERNYALPLTYGGEPPDFLTFGGGAFVGAGHLVLEDSLVTQNQASVGGGIYNAAGLLSLINTDIVANAPDDCVGNGCPT